MHAAGRFFHTTTYIHVSKYPHRIRRSCKRAHASADRGCAKNRFFQAIFCHLRSAWNRYRSQSEKTRTPSRRHVDRGFDIFNASPGAMTRNMRRRTIVRAKKSVSPGDLVVRRRHCGISGHHASDAHTKRAPIGIAVNAQPLPSAVFRRMRGPPTDDVATHRRVGARVDHDRRHRQIAFRIAPTERMFSAKHRVTAADAARSRDRGIAASIAMAMPSGSRNEKPRHVPGLLLWLQNTTGIRT
jgi:hypothetical protein